ncbi:hypothetical protein GCM10010272_67610 [Streptomyces lateritius]|nr:hypothetical protein GCM10010272_67610 [Streptomyces lateritius]
MCARGKARAARISLFGDWGSVTPQAFTACSTPVRSAAIIRGDVTNGGVPREHTPEPVDDKPDSKCQVRPAVQPRTEDVPTLPGHEPTPAERRSSADTGVQISRMGP